MRLFEDVDCMYSYRDEKGELQGGIYDCTIVSDKGSISFAVTGVGEQLLIDGNMRPIKCILHVNVMPLVTNLYVTDNNSIGLSNLNLRKILNMN